MGLTTGNFQPVDPATFMETPYYGRVRTIRQPPWPDKVPSPAATTARQLTSCPTWRCLRASSSRSCCPASTPRPPRLQASWPPAIKRLHSTVAHEPAADDQLAGRADHAKRAVRHSELAVVDVRARDDLELVADGTHAGLELERHAACPGVEAAADLQPLSINRCAVGHEPDLGAVLDVEEVLGTQVLVAQLVLRVEAARVDRQLDRGVLVQVERPS